MHHIQHFGYKHSKWTHIVEMIEERKQRYILCIISDCVFAVFSLSDRQERFRQQNVQSTTKVHYWVQTGGIVVCGI